MTAQQLQALTDYIDAAIRASIEDHSMSSHDNNGIWMGRTPEQDKYELGKVLRQEFGVEA